MNKQYNNRTIINYCPHTVSIYEGTIFDPATGMSLGGREILRIPASGTVATAKSCVEVMPDMEVDGISIPTCKRSFARVTEVPKDGKLYIVSSVFAAAAKELGEDVSHLLSPYGQVVDENGIKVGCTALVRYA